MSYKRSRATFESDQQGLPHHAPFAFYGTPLPAYESDARDDGSFVPVWKQTVTDERGRKRLHGAFTGGWSAGYFNTVGSKEGWAPSTFVSSRTNRAKVHKDGKNQEQRPEDFMDDEDLAEQAESQKLQIQDAFAGLGNNGEGGEKRGIFSDMFRPIGDTMGMKLLQRMGWKPGQGMGPKIKRRAKGDEKGDFHLFAPENSKMIRFIRKSDRKGLDFTGERKLVDQISSGNSGALDEDEDSGDDARILRTGRTKVPSKPKPLKKGAFGVGVLNDTGSDEDDPYSVGPRISYNRVVGGDKKKKPKRLGTIASTVGSNVVKPATSSKKFAQPAHHTAYPQKCHDGHLPLAGFVLSTTQPSTLEDDNFSPPEVPIGWTSNKQPSCTQNSNTTYQSTAETAKASNLNSTSRAALLGEQQLPGKSVFDYLSPTARDRLAAASGKQNLPPGLGESAPSGFEPSLSEQHRTSWGMVPKLDKDTAAAALQRGITGVLPFANDQAKQTRYRYFLELSVGSRKNLPERPDNVSIDEWARELREFADTAEVFRPVSGIMASRFTAPSREPKNATTSANATSGEPDKDEDPAEKAARLGMYGPLTRSYQPFYPTRLLCKRFNIKPPTNVAADPSMAAGSNDVLPDHNPRLDLVSQSSLNRMMMEAKFRQPKPRSHDSDADRNSESGATTQTQPAVVDAERNDALEGPKAGEAIFKAIFGSDDEED